MSDRKPNLVVVRAGEKSLHPGWLDQDYAERSFDLVVSYFSDRAFDDHPEAPGVGKVLIKGGKWDGLYKTLAGTDDLESYEHIWLPDDDIATDGRTIGRTFELAKEYALGVCQPSLSRESYYTHFMFSQCESFRLRYTNHVEIMVPCLSRDVLRRALPYFETTMSGFGLDYIWCRWPETGAFRAAILDEVAVHHTRPIGSQLKKAISDTGSANTDEEKAMNALFGIDWRVVPVAYAGIASDGQPVTGRSAMARQMYRTWTADLKAFRDPGNARVKALQILKRQYIKRLDLSELPDPKGRS